MASRLSFSQCTLPREEAQVTSAAFTYKSIYLGSCHKPLRTSLASREQESSFMLYSWQNPPPTAQPNQTRHSWERGSYGCVNKLTWPVLSTMVMGEGGGFCQHEQCLIFIPLAGPQAIFINYIKAEDGFACPRPPCPPHEIIPTHPSCLPPYFPHKKEFHLFPCYVEEGPRCPLPHI